METERGSEAPVPSKQRINNVRSEVHTQPLRRVFWLLFAVVAFGAICYVGTKMFYYMFIGMAYAEGFISDLEKNHPILNNLPILLTPFIVAGLLIYTWLKNRAEKQRKP